MAMCLYNFHLNYNRCFKLPSKRKSSRRKSSQKNQNSNVSRRAAKSANRMLIAGAIVVIILIIAALWLSASHAPATPAAPLTTTSVLPSISGTTQPGSSYTVQNLLTTLSSYKTPSRFTANYVGMITTSTPSASLNFTGSIISKYERFNGSALSATSEWSNQSVKFNTTSEYYFSSNSVSYYCFSNTTANYSCHSITIPFNISTFGLSTFLAALPGTGLDAPLTVANSSYNGMPCIALSAYISNSTTNSGVIVNTTVHVSTCIQRVYKIPLVLNISALDTESGVYYNGTSRVVVPTQSAQIMVGIRIVNLTNSSSEAEVTTLPANALMLG